jgi:hypothetical protein
MAAVVKEFPKRNPGGRPARYPWAKWTDGRIYKAKQGEDFECELVNFVQGLRMHAARNFENQKRVRTSIDVDEKTVTFQFYKL